MKYHNDLDENKNSLYNNPSRDKIQRNLNNYILNNKNQINYKDINKSKTFGPNLNIDYNLKKVKVKKAIKILIQIQTRLK